MTMAKPPIRTIVKPLMHRRDALIAPQARKAPAEVPSSSGVHADFVSLTSKRAAKVVEQARRIARCTPSDETKQTWEDVAAHARYRFAKRPDFKQPSLLREGLAQLKTGCVGSAVDTLRGGGAISHASLAGNLHLMLKICEAFAFDAREVRCAVHSWTLTSGGPAILHETCFGGGCLHVHGTHMYAAFKTQTTLH